MGNPTGLHRDIVPVTSFITGNSPGFVRDGQHYRVQIRLFANEDGSSLMGIAYRLGRVPRPSARRANLSKVGSIS